MVRPRTRDLVLLSFLYFPINLFWTAMLSQLLPARVETMMGDNKGLGMAIVGTGGSIVATIVSLLVGPLSDNTIHRNGRRYPWVVYGVLTGGLAGVGFSLASSVWQLLLAYALVRGGLHTAVAAYSAITPDRVPLEQQSRAAGFGELWDLAGTIGGTLLTILLAKDAVNRLLKANYSADAEVRIGIFVICVFCFCLMAFCLIANRRWICGERLPEGAARPWREVVWATWAWRPKVAPNFMRLFLSRCVLNIGIFTGFEFLRYYVAEAIPLNGKDLTMEVMFISLIFVAGGLCGALLGGVLGDKFSKRLLLYIFCSIAALSALGFCFATSFPQARVLAFGFGIGYSAISAVDWAFATTLVPKGQEARYLAIFQAAMTVPQIVVNLAGGLIGHHFGYRVLFWTIPFYIFAGMILVSKVKERHEMEEELYSGSG